MLEVCPGYTDKTTTLLADSGINDRLVKLRSLIDQTCFHHHHHKFLKWPKCKFIDIIYFGAVNFLSQNTPDAVFC